MNKKVSYNIPILISDRDKVIKGREYCMYFPPFYNCTGWGKRLAKAADTIVR